MSAEERKPATLLGVLLHVVKMWVSSVTLCPGKRGTGTVQVKAVVQFLGHKHFTQHFFATGLSPLPLSLLGKF